MKKLIIAAALAVAGAAYAMPPDTGESLLRALQNNQPVPRAMAYGFVIGIEQHMELESRSCPPGGATPDLLAGTIRSDLLAFPELRKFPAADAVSTIITGRWPCKR